MARAKTVEYTATIEYLERLRSSFYGNPRYLIHFADGSTAKTEVDGSVAYGLENNENLAGPVTVKAYARSGNVFDVRPVR